MDRGIWMTSKIYTISQWVDFKVKILLYFYLVTWIESDAHQGARHADHISGNGAEFAHDPLSFSSGPIDRKSVV